MTLAFDERRLLPAGVHDATLDVVKQFFAGFQKTDRRMRLFAKLHEYSRALEKTGWQCSLILDGSFVMACVDEPEDIDLILVLPSDWDMQADLKPYEYNLVSKKRVRKEYGIEVYAVQADSADEQNWLAFFSGVNPKWRRQFGWPPDATKGMVRVVP